MARTNFIGKKWWVLASLVAVFGAAAGWAWRERDRLEGFYLSYQLARAEEADRAKWVERAVAKGDGALPIILRCLDRDDPRACANAHVALAQWVKQHGTSEAHLAHAAGRLANGFSRFSALGQQKALEIETQLLKASSEKPGLLPEIVRVSAPLPGEAARSADRGVRTRALDLVLQLVHQPDVTAVREPGRELTRACLMDDDPDNRIRAVRLASQASIGLLERAVTLLNDPVVEVRRAAMLEIGPAPEVLATDDLLPFLHDPDAKVRQLCEKALLGRGLRENHLRIGRLMTDERPQKRLEVVEQLHRFADLEPGVWLRRLSHDPVPAVRAAAVRAAGDYPGLDLSDRLEQMAQNDPSPTVRQMARYFSAARKSGN